MDLVVSPTPEALADRVAQDFGKTIAETVAAQGRFTIALAGGVTPKLFYSRLTQDPYRNTIPWNKLWIFFGDERCVPPDQSDSNYGMVKQSLLDHVSAMPSQVFRMKGEEAPPEAARAYEKVLKDIFKSSSTDEKQEWWPRFDLILLGMGPDGHVASLLAGTPALTEHGNRWVVGNVVRQLQTVRITMTMDAINHAQRVWFLVTGAKKREAFARAQEFTDPSCPASLVDPVNNGELRWYVDQAVI